MRDVSMRPYTAVALAAALALAGCANPPELLTIEVSVTGLASNGLHIRNSVTNGDAYFGAGDTSGQIRIPKVSKPDPHEAGSNESVFEWALAIQKQPVGDTCELGGAVTGRLVADSNKLGQQKVTLTITCHPAGTVFTHSLGGTVNGLTASGLVLANGAAQLPVTPTTGGPVLFQFADQLAQGTTYDVSVATQPAGQTCAVAAGSGTMGSADIANVVVTCSARTGQIAVDVTGLGAASGLKLANNQVEQEVPGGSTLFTFPDQVPVGAQYSLAVTASPASLVCSLPATSGTFPASSADGVLNVGTVSCAVAPPPTYRIGGHVNGLVGSGLQLALNGGNALAISADGAFAFGNQLQSGAA